MSSTWCSAGARRRRRRTELALPTPSQTVGPFFNIGMPGVPAELVAAGSDGAVRLAGMVFDGEERPVPDALIEIWQADRAGRYDADGFRGFGRAETDERGTFAFVTVKPGPVPAPAGGMQAPHIAVSVFARGLLKRLVTRVYFPDEADANAADPVLAAVDPLRRETLVARDEGEGLRFDIRLQGPGETVFFDV